MVESSLKEAQPQIGDGGERWGACVIAAVEESALVHPVQLPDSTTLH